MKVMDLHCDTIYEIRKRRNKGQTCGLRENDLHIDLMRMKGGDYALQTFALFVDTEEEDSPFFASMELLDIFREEIAANEDLIRQVITWKDFEENEKTGRMSALLSVEDGGVSMGVPDILEEYRKAGVRMMTMTWNHENVFGYPNYSAVSPGENILKAEERGLKAKGLEALELMEDLGIIPDVSHLSDGGFWDVAKHTKKPFVASHSNARTVTNHLRNLTDEMIKEVAGRGGLIGLNYCAAFLRTGWTPDSRPAGGTIEEMVAQLRYMIDVGGVECIALGSDFDGIQDVSEISSCEHMPRLAEAMEHNGFTEDEIEKVFYGNVRRFLKENL